MLIYVGVNTPGGLVLVTSVNPLNGCVLFERHKKPISFRDDIALSVCKRLVRELYQAVIINSYSEIDNQPFVVTFR